MSNFDRGKIVMRYINDILSILVLGNYQKWSNEGQPVNQRQVMGS